MLSKEKFERHYVRLIVVMIILGIFAALGVVYYLRVERAPDYKQMRAYRLSLITGELLRDIYLQAAAETEARRVLLRLQKDEALKSAAPKVAECNTKMEDPAFRTKKNVATCNRLFLIEKDSRFDPPTIEAVFEEIIVGPCKFARTIREARALNCLPAS